MNQKILSGPAAGPLDRNTGAGHPLQLVGGRAQSTEATARSTVRALPWPSIGLTLVLLLAAGLNLWGLDRLGYSNTYYAAAVRSMLLNWHNFFFNAFDPGGFVTIDKPPLGFWLQVTSAKLFGYNGVSLLLPQALAGVGAVAVLYALVRRVWGVPAGLLAALFLALTPVVVVDSRNNTIDSTLVLILLLAAWAASKAAETGRPRWLALCAVLVGLGFNVKMLEAYLALPALGLLYLLGARAPWRTRLLHATLCGALLLAVSLSWAVAVDLTPASQRPWVDSTSTNSEVDLAVGYNGLQRLLGRAQGGGAPLRQATTTTGATGPSATATHAIVGAGPAQPAGSGGPQGGGGGGMFNNGAVGPLRLFNGQLGGQASWLLPLALIGLLATAARRWRFPLDRERQAVLLWGTWLLTVGAFFSVAGFFHPYYLITLAPAVAALAAAGVVTLCRAYLAPQGAAWRAWLLLPLSLLVTAGVQAVMLTDYPTWSLWITPPMLAGALLAAGVLVAVRLRLPRRLTLWQPALAVSLLPLLIAPTTWTVQTVRAGSGGGIPSAGPAAVSAGNGFPGGGPGGMPGGGPAGGPNTVQPAQGGAATAGGATRAGGAFPGGAGFPGGFGGGRSGDTVDKALLSYLEGRQGATTYLLAVGSSNSAAPYIIQTGKAVMSLGGFSGSNPILTTTQLKALIKNNTVRYFLVGGGGGRDNSALTTWVQGACTAVPSSAWQTASAASAATANQQGDDFMAQALYDCRASTARLP